MSDNSTIITKFLLQYPSILFNKNNFYKIIPTPSMTKVEKLNTLTRLVIYIMILYLLFSTNYKYTYLFIIIIIILISINYLNNKKIINTFINDLDKNITKNNLMNIDVLTHMQSSETISPYVADGIAHEQDTGTISSDNLSLYDRLSRRLRRDAQHPCSSPHIADDLAPEQGSGAISPHIADDNKISDNKLQNYFNNENIDNSLYGNFFDRQFYIMPSTTIPNDQTGFAKWLYTLPETCKENQKYCIKYENLKYIK